jgi:hypothetical protein
MRFLRSNTAVIVTVGPFYDKTDGVTIETALTITNERITLTADTDAGSAPTNILDNVTGATSGTSNDLNYITGNDAGMMQLELAAADVNRVGRMMLSITDAANHVPVFHEFFVLPQAIYDWLTGVIVPLPANVTQLLGTAWLTPGTAGTPDVNAKLIGATTQTGRDVGAMSASNYEQGAVWMDTGAGTAGTTSYVHGTHLLPNSSMANSRTIANALSLKRFMVLNSSTITLDQGYAGFTFAGYRWSLALANRSVSDCHILNATVTGIATTGPIRFEGGSLGTCTLPAGCTAFGCFVSGTMTIGATGTYVFANCNSETAAGTDWIVDFDAVTGNVCLRNFAGAVQVVNMNAGDVFVFNGNGKLTIAASCTGGTVNIQGNVELVNSGTGQTISDDGRVTQTSTRDKVIERTAVRVVVGAGSTATTVVASSVTTTLGVAVSLSAGQFNGQIAQFDTGTTTAGLRNFKLDVLSHTTGATPTFTLNGTMSATPASGDLLTVG